MPRASVTPIDQYRPRTLADQVSAFLEARRRILGPRVEKTTIRAYRHDLARFLAAFGGQDLQALTSDSLERYLRGLNKPDGSPLAPATLNRHRGSLVSFFGWLEEQGTIARTPMKGIRKARVPEAEPGTLSEETCVALLARAKKLGTREHALVALLLATGLRASEALALDVRDLDLGQLVLTVRHGKGDKARQVFITADERRVLRRLLAKHPDPRPHAPLFTSNRGRLSYPRASALFKEIADGLSNPDGSSLHLHQTRHTMATRLLAAGMNPIHLATLTGHADLRTLDRYTKAAKTAAAEAEFRKFMR